MAKADMKITFDEDGLEFLAKLTDKLEAVCARLEGACARLEQLQPKPGDPQGVRRPRPDMQPDSVTINLQCVAGTDAGRRVLDALERLKEWR